MGGTSEPIPSSGESDGMSAYNQIAATSQDYEPIPSSDNSNQVDMSGSTGNVQPGQIPSQGGNEKGSPSIQPKSGTTAAAKPSTNTSDVSQQGAMQRQESQPISASPNVDSSIQEATGQDGDMHQGSIQRQEHEQIPSSGVIPSVGVTPRPSTSGVTTQSGAGNVPAGPNMRQASEAIPSVGVAPQPSTSGVTTQSGAGNVPTGPNVRQASEAIPSVGVAPQPSTPIVTQSSNSGNVQQGPVASTGGGQGITMQPNQKSSTINPKTYGHKQTVHTNTILGGNPSVQQFKERVTRAGNSGFTLGQNIRRMSNNIGKVGKGKKTRE
ncbi:hypothetical protein OL548_19995 [Lysinibacillus sp. MHQ-1]|nr:hypothetical protein OL548_19995 [Lysinibacillus sp. MHQ-1]